MNVRAELHRLIDDCLDDDPRGALIAVRRLERDHLPWLEARAVVKARTHSWNWAQIGRLLGRIRQAVRSRYRGPVPSTPRSPYAGVEDPVRAWQHMHADFRRRREFEGDEITAW